MLGPCPPARERVPGTRRRAQDKKRKNVGFGESSSTPSALFLLFLSGGRNVEFSKKKGLPLPLGRGVCETKSKNGRSRPRKPFFSRVFCSQWGIETMVSEGARPWGRGRSGDCEESFSCFFPISVRAGEHGREFDRENNAYDSFSRDRSGGAP